MTGRHRPGRPPGLPPPPPPKRPPPPPPGPRRAALEDRRKRARNRARLLGGLLAVILIAGIAAALALREPADDDPVTADDPVEVVRPEDPTSTLLAGTRSGARGRDRLVWVSLLVLDPDAERSVVAYIPPLTATEVPGRGPHPLTEAYTTGGMPLLVLATENMLGVRIDRHVDLSERDALRFFEAVAPLEVEVPETATIPVDEDIQLLFERGAQSLEADALMAYTYRLGEEGDAGSMGPRHLAMWSALFSRVAADPDGTEAALSEAAGAFRSADDPEEVTGFLTSFLTDGSSRTVRSLPVEPLEVPGDPIYVTVEEEIRAFVAELVSDELRSEDPARVQILNGNGAPGIGQRVARRLVGNGFRVALTGNARSLEHRRTLIITYDTSQEGRDRAARARELLGVGEVQVSLQEQGIVDLTIVVGRDFLRAD